MIVSVPNHPILPTEIKNISGVGGGVFGPKTRMPKLGEYKTWNLFLGIKNSTTGKVLQRRMFCG